MDKKLFLSILSIASLTFGACSPLAPSVSKFAGSTSKSPTSGDNTSSIETTKSSLTSSKSVDAAVVTSSEYDQIKSSHNKPHEELTKGDVEDLAVNSKASFYANDNSVAGFEDDLIKQKVKVYMIVTSLTKSERQELQDNIKVSVTVDRTNKLIVSVVNTEKSYKDKIMKHLTSAAIEFETTTLATQ